MHTSTMTHTGAKRAKIDAGAPAASDAMAVDDTRTGHGAGAGAADQQQQQQAAASPAPAPAAPLCSREQMQQYYARLFPAQQMHRWLAYANGATVAAQQGTGMHGGLRLLAFDHSLALLCKRATYPHTHTHTQPQIHTYTQHATRNNRHGRAGRRRRVCVAPRGLLHLGGRHLRALPVLPGEREQRECVMVVVVVVRGGESGGGDGERVVVVVMVVVKWWWWWWWWWCAVGVHNLA